MRLDEETWQKVDDALADSNSEWSSVKNLMGSDSGWYSSLIARLTLLVQGEDIRYVTSVVVIAGFKTQSVDIRIFTDSRYIVATVNTGGGNASKEESYVVSRSQIRGVELVRAHARWDDPEFIAAKVRLLFCDGEPAVTLPLDDRYPGKTQPLDDLFASVVSAL